MAANPGVIPPRPQPPRGRLCASIVTSHGGPAGELRAVAEAAYSAYIAACLARTAAIEHRAKELVCDKS